MLYVPSVPDATTSTISTTISGRSIAHGKRTKAERAFVAADLHLGLQTLVAPTVGQAASLLHVSKTYIEAAIAIVISDDAAKREAVIAGELALIDAAKSSTTETLAAHFARASREEWREAARVIGPAVIWDHMIAPLV